MAKQMMDMQSRLGAMNAKLGATAAVGEMAAKMEEKSKLSAAGQSTVQVDGEIKAAEANLKRFNAIQKMWEGNASIPSTVTQKKVVVEPKPIAAPAGGGGHTGAATLGHRSLGL